MIDIEILKRALNEKMGNSRSLNEHIVKDAIINACNDLISEFKQNVCVHKTTINEGERIIKVGNIASILSASFQGKEIPIFRLQKSLQAGNGTTRLIVMDTESVRIEPFNAGELEIIGSFYIAHDVTEIPLSKLFYRAIMQGATYELFVTLDKPLEHIKSAKLLYNEAKDELRTQINRAQEKQAIITRNIIL